MPALIVFYSLAVLLWAAAGAMCGAAGAFYVGLAVAAAILVWQVATLDIADGANCLVRFKSNKWVGWALTAGLAVEIVLIRF